MEIYAKKKPKNDKRNQCKTHHNSMPQQGADKHERHAFAHLTTCQSNARLHLLTKRTDRGNVPRVY